MTGTPDCCVQVAPAKLPLHLYSTWHAQEAPYEEGYCWSLRIRHRSFGARTGDGPVAFLSSSVPDLCLDHLHMRQSMADCGRSKSLDPFGDALHAFMHMHSLAPWLILPSRLLWCFWSQIPLQWSIWTPNWTRHVWTWTRTMNVQQQYPSVSVKLRLLWPIAL